MIYATYNQALSKSLAWAKRYLASCSVPNADIDSVLIMSHLLGCRAIDLHTAEQAFDEESEYKFDKFVKLRAKRYPLQYITGTTDFMGLRLNVRPGVFIPRQETELLVEKTIDIAKGFKCGLGDFRILDMCTGSGNIAISLTKFLNAVKIIAADISPAALEVARENIALHKCHNIELVKSDLFYNLPEDKFDIIVSNPPYVSEEDFINLEPELLYEPKTALYAEKDGLKFYRKILEKAGMFLKENSYLILEVGYNQAEALKRIFDSSAYLLEDIVKDYNNIERVMIFRRRNG